MSFQVNYSLVFPTGTEKYFKAFQASFQIDFMFSFKNLSSLSLKRIFACILMLRCCCGRFKNSSKVIVAVVNLFVQELTGV